MLPEHLLPHSVVRVRPAESTDAYNDTVRDYGPAATRTTLRAWIQQEQRRDVVSDGRDPDEQRWLLMCNLDDLRVTDRIEWADHPTGPVVFEVYGPPEPAYTPRGFHHTEATLRIVEG